MKAYKIISLETTKPTPTRLLNWEACYNTRELGGYPLVNGGETRWKALVRSDNLSQLTSTGQQALIDYGIRTVIDLRFPEELVQDPNPFSHPAASLRGLHPQVINLPMANDQNLEWPAPQTPAEAMCDLYCRVLEKSRRHVAAVLTAIARALPGGVLFHCHAGKDRTGLIAALILAAVGASPETIIEDYAFTYPLLDRRRKQDLEDPSLTPEQRSYWSVLFEPLPETMRLTLDYLDRRYGGAAGYLRTTPLLAGDLRQLQDRIRN